MGELLRSAHYKQLPKQHQVKLRTKALHMHQRGISMPGACEALGGAPWNEWWQAAPWSPKWAADLDPVKHVRQR